MASNRDRALAAAIDLLATNGIRALTHLQVDQHAGLPRGSTSNAFRTREALLVGVCEHMANAELPAITASVSAGSISELTDSLTGLFAQLTGPGRTVTAARLALFVEAGHDAAVRNALAKGRSIVESPVTEAFAALGARHPATAVQLVAIVFEGLFLHVIGGRAPIDPLPLIDATVRAALEA